MTYFFVNAHGADRIRSNSRLHLVINVKQMYDLDHARRFQSVWFFLKGPPHPLKKPRIQVIFNFPQRYGIQAYIRFTND